MVLCAWIVGEPLYPDLADSLKSAKFSCKVGSMSFGYDARIVSEASKFDVGLVFISCEGVGAS